MNPVPSEAQPPSADEIGRILRHCGLEPPPRLVESVTLYSAILHKWNRRINLTSLTSPTEVVTSHFAESFFAAGYLGPSDTPLLDIGSGAGFPGLAMKLYRPSITLYLVEPRSKRAAFLSTIRRELGLSDVFVLNKTIEECCDADFKEKPGCLTLRAVGEAPALIRCGLLLARSKARVMLFLTRGKVDTILSELQEIMWKEPVPVPWSRERIIALGKRSVSGETLSRDRG